MSDFNPATAAPVAPTWPVWRMDDNGNRFLIREGVAAREDAERMVAEFTARGHKQVYWAQPEGADRG